MATYMGRDVAKLKAKGGKWKYMSEKEMLDIAAKFSPYRSVEENPLSFVSYRATLTWNQILVHVWP